MNIQKFKMNFTMEKTEHFIFLRKDNHFYLSNMEHEKVIDCFDSFIDWVKFEISPERNGWDDTEDKLKEISKFFDLIPKWKMLIDTYLKEWEYSTFFECFENNIFEIKDCFYNTNSDLMENEINLIAEFIDYFKQSKNPEMFYIHKLDSGIFFDKFVDESRKFCKSCAPIDRTELKNYCETMENLGNCKYKIFQDTTKYEKCFPHYSDEIQKSDYPLKRN
jgi:hypothetical protein